MASDTTLNIVLGQGHAVKKIYNVKKQNLELQQHFAAQHTDVKEKRKKGKGGEIFSRKQGACKGGPKRRTSGSFQGIPSGTRG
jgi:hypothetical protein